MVVIGKKKYKSGEGSLYVTRKAALKKLQLSLNEFRRLCILKGIYPREPRNRKRAQKGQPGIKILYHLKDIQFLMHEPIIWKLREYKIFNRKVSHARAVKDFRAMKRYLRNHPTIKLDHIVKERYPTFIDALKDLDDCLTLCFLFSTFPSMSHVPREQSILCRRLTVEFMHAVIAAKALRKVFVSIKGYYFQAELKGETITWIVPHHFGFEPQAKAEVDFKLMSIFVEFYVTMLGFVNFRLYHSLNLYYPPKLTSGFSSNSEQELIDEEAFVSERVNALSIPLVNLDNTSEIPEEEVVLDTFTSADDSNETSEAKVAAQQEAEKVRKLKTLFKGMKVFLNREVPREPLVFILRCFGAEVSWDKTLFVGSTFDEDDESITHHIVDRPSMDSQFLSRCYVQPQWVFDSVNARELMPVEKYLMGCVLPPHLSPFTDSRRDQTYIPPEERALMDPEYKMNYDKDELDSEFEKDDDEKMEDDQDEENETEEKEKEVVEEEKQVFEEETDSEEEILNKYASKKGKSTEEEKQREEKKKQMKVKSGEILKQDPFEKERQAKHEYKLREKMIQKKHRKLYRSMMEGRQERAKAIWLLRKKRRIHETKEKENRKAERKAARKANEV